MRIAKIAEDEGGAETGGTDDTGGSLRGRGACTAIGGAGTDAGRAGGFEAGRGGAATGRGGVALGFAAVSGSKASGRMTSPLDTMGSDDARASVGSDGARTSDGSDGERVVAGELPSSASTATSPGFERRRGIGGGALSGGTEPGTGGNAGTSFAASVGAASALA